VTYRDAGVDIEGKAYLLAELGSAIQQTHGTTAGGWGGFAGVVRLPAGSGALAVTIDGAGTKTVIARWLGRDRVIGSDIVAHRANDLLAAGARPLAFVDYVAMSRLDAQVVRALIQGMVEECRRLGIALAGGETAEMPSIYHEETYDVVGKMVGVVVAEISQALVRAGDQAIGLASTGLHTNGYALARRLVEGMDLLRHVDALGASPGDALLAPHRCYAPAVLSLLDALPVHGIAHITGGGLPGNLPRILPPGLGIRLTATWPIPPIFGYLQRLGGVDEEEMRRTFNLGAGMVVLTDAGDAARALTLLQSRGETAWVIGEVVEGAQEVVFG
jgi:phosphoribosylformylglycinamidine cyclo-ligase